jgi:3-hydroxyacyl-CoA dehydrogenase/enoyl-CoA hydratase/3-hydroxybutyryl-CoA epimerase
MEELRYRLDRKKNIAVFEIDTSGPVNTIGEQFIADLVKATEKANSDGVKGVVLASAKAKSFLDGANLMEIMKDPSQLNLKHVVLKLQETLANLAKSPFPVVAVLTGQTVLGGGFETLLWTCDHIFSTTGSKMGLPEVNVGLFPAGGGPETLRKIAGLKTALDVVMGGKVLPAEFYSKSGLVTMVSKDEIFQEAEKWIEGHQGIINRNYDPDWKEPDLLLI